MFFETKKINTTYYGARVHLDFRISAREFKSIETSPGFAKLLRENWSPKAKSPIDFTMPAKNCQITKV